MSRRCNQLTGMLLAGLMAALRHTHANESGVAEDWIFRHEIASSRGRLYFRSAWNPMRSLRLKLSCATDGRSVLLELHRQTASIRPEPEKAFPAELVESTQFNVSALPDRVLESARLVFTCHPQMWVVYVEDRPVVSLPAPFHPPVRLYQRPDDLPPENERDTRFQKTEEHFRWGDDFSPTDDRKNPLEQWEMIAGTWSLHTVVDTSSERGDIRPGTPERRYPKPDFSPNFSCLEGKGTPGVILTGYPHCDSYIVEASVLALPGEMGIVFFATERGAYHAFTVALAEHTHRALYRLWRGATASPQERTNLAAVTASLTKGQWIRMRVKTFSNRVQCFVDDTRILDVSTELPAGGRFGFYVHRPAGTRFDDLFVKAHHDLDFRTMNDIRRHTLVERGSFFPRRRFFHLFPPKDTGNAFEVDRSREEQWLVMGTPDAPGHVMGATFEPASSPHEVGLILQYRDDTTPYMRWRCRRAGASEIFRLERVESNTVTLLEETRFPWQSRDPPPPVCLLADLTNQREANPGEWVSEREVRCYRDGQLVLIHHLDADPRGASGLWVGAQTRARIRDVVYSSEREGLYRNKFEKNRRFVEDPFMRHWSSPEGQWIESKSGLTWYRGDFFGRMLLRMPWVDRSELHLGVGETNTQGDVVIRAVSNRLTLAVTDAEGRLSDQASVSADTLVPYVAEGKDVPRKWYRVHVEDYWVWVTGKDGLLFKVRLEQPLAGTRVRIAGFNTESLKHSYVERFQVKDYLFTEAPYEWTVNGGRWDVVNRFQCQPRWSHMNGENPNGLAALWSKYRFRGDFCLELFAGIRHRWYATAGDLNVTVMADCASPSRGYTVTCTAWDPDRSQRHSHLYRNGVRLDTSDQYLVPRNREGGQRRGYEPLIRSGRDLHGAWYYIKFRRIGRKLEYYFDNDLVFAREDESPLDSGLFGVWTFLNSMMVARVKMAARSIEPLGFSFEPVPPDTAPPAPPDVTPWAAESGELFHHGRPLELTVPSAWLADDPTGQAETTWVFSDSGIRCPAWITTTVLGSGEMFTRCRLPPVKYDDLAGWHMEVKRTPGAHFNFHYSIGTLNPKGEFIPMEHFFHHLSGDDFSKGTFRMSGATPLPATEASGPTWHKQGVWTPVFAWLPPPEQLPASAKPKDLWVQVEGFGNLAPSLILQGLLGNRPGEAYAVRRFAEIRYGIPSVHGNPDRAFPRRVVIIEPRSQQPFTVCTNVVQVQEAVRGIAREGLNHVLLRIERERGVTHTDLAWIALPAQPAWTCRWSVERPNTVVLASAENYPDRRLFAAELFVGGVSLPLITDRFLERSAPLPRCDTFLASRLDPLPIRITAPPSLVLNASLLWRDNVTQEGPVLLKLRGLTPLALTFEDRQMPTGLHADGPRIQLRLLDAEQGACLKVANLGKPQRLTCHVSRSLDLARHPLLQFRYRARGMVHVSLALSGGHTVALSESFHQASTVRYASNLSLDGQWQTWFGMISDAVKDGTVSPRLFTTGGLTFGSRHAVDQTGLFSEWLLDDLVAGPAVGPENALTFTPEYFDHQGVAKVELAIRHGPEPYTTLNESERHALSWRVIPNHASVTPDISALSDGPAHLFLRAEDTRGHCSAITDIPILVDRTPPRLTYRFERSTSPFHNGSTLNIAVHTDGGAPVSLSDLVLKWNDVPVPLEPLGSTFQHRPQTDVLILNWPYLFRHALHSAEEGKTNFIVVAQIRDGAGNPAPVLRVPVVLDVTKDTTPPTLLPITPPSNVLHWIAWESDQETSSQLVASHPLRLIRKPGEEAYATVSLPEGHATLTIPLAHRRWTLDRYPYLAFRLRHPDLHAADDFHLRFQLVLAGGRKISLWLTSPPPQGQAQQEPSVVVSDLAWTSNRWVTATLDLPQRLQAILGESNFQTARIEQVALDVYNRRKRAVLDVQTLVIFGPWRPEDSIHIEAFDESGTEDIICAQERLLNGPAVAPAQLARSDAGNRWMVMRARDRAGNLSRPVSVPLGPSPTPTVP